MTHLQEEIRELSKITNFIKRREEIPIINREEESLKNFWLKKREERGVIPCELELMKTIFEKCKKNIEQNCRKDNYNFEIYCSDTDFIKIDSEIVKKNFKEKYGVKISLNKIYRRSVFDVVVSME